MACEVLGGCQFFKDSMENLLKTAEYLQHHLCHGDYERCNRYRIYKEFGVKDIPLDLHPNDAEEVKIIIQCLRTKRLSPEEQYRYLQRRVFERN